MGTKSEIVSELINKNKEEGFILKDEILVSFEQFNLTDKQLNRIVKKIEMAGIQVFNLELNNLSEELSFLDSEYLSSSDIFISDGLTAYLKSISRYPVLSFEEEKYYAKIIATSDNKDEVNAAKKIMTECNLKYVVSIAKHYKIGMPLLDLIQEGNLGLMKAIDKYDYKKNFRFSTYAIYWIRQAIKKALYENGIIRVPIHIAQSYRRINAAYNKLVVHNNGRNPTPEEISAETKISLKKVRELLAHNYVPSSLDAVLNQDSGDDNCYISEIIPDTSESVEDKIFQTSMNNEIQELLDGLQDKEKSVIILRLGLNGDNPKTLEQVGQELNLTRERIRQIEKQTLIKLRGNPKVQHLKNFLE